MVVAGINKGANLGAYVLGRSGTVSAAVEAAFFDVPAIAVSLYVPGGGDVPWEEQATDPVDYREAAAAGRYLARHAVDAGVFDHAEYLNVNAPMPAAVPGADADLNEDGTVPDRPVADMEITKPSTAYEMTATKEGDRIRLQDRLWERMRTGDIPDPEGTDRRAVVEGRVSVSPLTAPHTVRHHDALDGLAETYRSSVSALQD
jgi:5'-nucleotidase